MGATLHVPEHYINMEGVIPNSRVVILPPSDGGESGEGWKRELFLRPGQWIPWVTVTCVVGMMILAIIVFILHLNEKVGLLFSPAKMLLIHGICYREKMSWREDEFRIISTSMLCSSRQGTVMFRFHLFLCS